MAQTTATPKTKSKARYLKAKKERRKKRKAATAVGNTPSRQYAHTESKSETSDHEVDPISETVLMKDVPRDKQPSQQPLEPPTKKRKQSHKERELSPLDHDADDLLSDETTYSPSGPISPVELPTLPSFPLPTQPAPPSKAVLALQGLDKAILEAEIIDPTVTARIPAPGELDSLGLGINDRMRERLLELGIDNLFAVQTVLLPFLLSKRDLHCPYDPPEDACVSAPTGSGKTLAYIVPITEACINQLIVTRLRTLVVLPTRELAMQVRETFDFVAKGRGLKIAIATGQHSFAHEQSQLVSVSPPSAIHSSPQYHSKVDVLICTPGRLIDHLNGTPGFTLEHLRFLVIDEADRLITQSFQDWLAHVLEATQPRQSNFPTTELDEPYHSSCQKLLFSATLTHDPSKIVPLGLRNPRYFVVGDQTGVGAEEETFAFPAKLSEHMCVCSPADKPLVLFHLVHTHGIRNALIFTKSAESTTRLVQLFEFFEAARNREASEGTKRVTMQAYSSDLSGQERKSVIERFKEGKIDFPVKSLGVVSDSEGEEDRVVTTVDDLFEREVNAARSSDSRDWFPNQPATIATNLSSHISDFTALPGPLPTMQAESSGIGDFDSSATKPRPRPRPRMRPVPPPDQPESSSIGTFPTINSDIYSVPETLASFDNSAVQAVPGARPPSLPPSSFPGADSASSSVPTPTFPTLVPLKPLETPAHPDVSETRPSGVVSRTLGTETASANPKRPRPKMRPPPLPEPDVATTTTTATASSTTTAIFSADPHTITSTSATSVSSASKSNPSRSSALEEAEEYTGRGARRITQISKPIAALPPFPDPDVDVGGPEDNHVSDVIMLVSTDDEYSGPKTKAKAKAKPKPKKKDAHKVGSAPAQSDNIVEQVPAPAKSTLKRKTNQLQSSDDEFGRWDSAIPGGSAATGKHKNSGVPDSSSGGAPSAQPVVPNTIEPPNPIGGPGYRRATSSPLSSPGHSPELKRKAPPNTVAEEPAAQSSAKKPRKSDFVGVVLTGPSGGDGKKSKRPRKQTTKAAAEDDGANDQANVLPELSSVKDTSTSIVPSESSKTKNTPPTSNVPSIVAQELENAPMDIDGMAATKKQPKKRAPKGKKSAINEETAVADASAQEDPAPKKCTKGKGKGKGKEKELAPMTTSANDEVGASSSNQDAGAALTTLSNSSADAGPQPTSSDPSATTPASKPKPRPRHSTTPAPLPVAMGASGSLLRSASGKSAERPLSETLRLAFGGAGSPAPRMGLSRRGSSKIAPLLAFRGAPPPPPPPMPKKPTKKKKGDSDDDDEEEGPEWEGLTEKQKEKKRREKEMAGWYSDG
ncbi:unnamed protein product [Rhizoctonia solani]|uniref:ATP-dependent RNA helicase n=1 Tax=Rhizoctonia solani TaxID=456999 RepID=A0A8H3A6C6_9AGAM|nr:unnamed protein product [Rhizoctonia solani]